MSVILTADWKLETVAGRVYGVCTASWSPPFDRFDHERGFTLPNPTHLRVAAQSLAWSLEAVAGCCWLKRGVDSVVVATKHGGLHDLLMNPSKVAAWRADNRWPKTQLPNKALLRKCDELLHALNDGGVDFVTLVYIEREQDDSAEIDLDENRTDEGFDIQSFMRRKATQEEIEKAVQETSMNGVRASKLLASGARCYRSGKKL